MELLWTDRYALHVQQILHIAYATLWQAGSCVLWQLAGVSLLCSGSFESCTISVLQSATVEWTDSSVQTLRRKKSHERNQFNCHTVHYVDEDAFRIIHYKVGSQLVESMNKSIHWRRCFNYICWVWSWVFGYHFSVVIVKGQDEFAPTQTN